jgi:NifU-like protein involved in Fe-S cluster formation
VRIAVALDDGRLGAVRFTGDACAICIAAADLLAEMATGRPVAEAEAIDRERLLGALEAEIRPTRMRCVILPLGVLKAALSASRTSR